MMNRSVFFLLGLASLSCLVCSAPLSVIDEALDDTAIVESTIREVRAAKDSEYSPAKWEKVYDSGDKGDIGYTRQKADKGKTGYQKFDSFHKKGGDSYGYEKHDSFGLKEKSGAGGSSGKAAYVQKEGDGKAAKYQASPDDGGSYEVFEESEGDADEGGEVSDAGETGEGGDDVSHYEGEEASEEEGGIQESGYDENDAANYDNPTHYSYGSGNEYDFK